jgi:hypothetical protein
LKKTPICLLFLLPASLISLSCGGYTAPGSTATAPKYRAFISNGVSGGGVIAGIYVVNAQDDVRASGAPISAGNNPGMMVLTPNRAQTLVFSSNGLPSSDNAFSIISNAGQSSSGHLTMPGMTESFVVSPDSSTVYVALPTAPVIGQSPGVVEVVSLSGGSFTGQADVPAVHYISINNSGSRILGFSDNSDSVAIITPSQIGLPNGVVTTYVGGFDRPVQAFFSSDDSTAYVVNCGPECGGTQAGVQILDMTTSTLGASVSVPAATAALLNNSTLYLAGTPQPDPNPQPCTGETTASTSCGLLTLVDVSSMTVIGAPIVITDGYHTRLSLAANGQLFIGARTCTEIVQPFPVPVGAEVRGCLSIYNTLTGAVGSIPAGGVVIPPANGDVTGIQPISLRNVVYVIQGGSLGIYSTAIDALQPNQITNLVGSFVDVLTVDF